MSTVLDGLRRALVIMLPLLGCILLLVVSATAQVQTGRIVGTVYDPNRAAVPNANVTVTASATNQSVTTATNDRGEYVVTPLNPGIYRVVVSSQGFQAMAISSVE